MDIYKRIKKDHDEAREIINKLNETTPRAEKTRRELFDKFKLDLWAHHKVEEAVFYSVFRTNKELKSEAYEALNEHHVANGLLEELDTFPVTSEEWGVKFAAASELIEHHMDEEEEDTFPAVKKVMDEDVAKLLGDRFDARKKIVLAAIQPITDKDIEAA